VLPAHDLEELVMLVEGRPVVVSGLEQRGLDRCLADHRPLGMARADLYERRRNGPECLGPEACGAGHECFDLSACTDGGDDFLIPRAFVEHAKLEHCPCAAVEFDDHVTVVENVRTP
jgi:hypothetical protein